MIVSTIDAALNTLEHIEVKGKSQLEMLLGVINALEAVKQVLAQPKPPEVVEVHPEVAEVTMDG